MGRILKTVATVGGLTLLWLVLVGDFQPQELLVGALSVAGTTVFVVFVRRAQEQHFRYKVRDVVRGWRVPGNIVADTFRVGKVLRDVWTGTPPRSCYVVSPFDGSHANPVCGGREVLAVAYMTASPNSIVLGVDTDRGQMLIHLLERAPLSSMAKDLGAGARGDG